MTNDLKTITIKISSSVKPENRKYQAYANTLKDCLLKDDFLRKLQDWKFTTEMIEDLESVMLRCPRYSLNTKQMEWLEEYRNNVCNRNTHKKDNLKKHSFDNIIQYRDKEELKKRLHELIDGKSGKDVGIVLARAKTVDGYLTRFPTQKEYESEFELNGSWQSISNYFYKDDNTTLGSVNSIIIFNSI